MNSQLRVPTNPATLKKMGAFDSYVKDEQEKSARAEYAEFCKSLEGLSQVALDVRGGIPSFDEWCMIRRDREHD